MGAIDRSEATAPRSGLTTEHTEGTAMAEPKKAGLLYEEETYAVIGACFEVHKEKGCGACRSTSSRR